jgi:hypothetical protein
LVMASYTKYNDADNREEEKVLASADQDGYVFYHLMNEGFFDNGTPANTTDDYGRVGFSISASQQNGGLSFIFSYYADSATTHFQYVYSDKFWGSFVKMIEYNEDGSFKQEIGTEQAPVAGDQNEWSQRASIQAKVQGYGTTTAGGFTFTSAMAGEQAGKNPFNGGTL